MPSDEAATTSVDVVLEKIASFVSGLTYDMLDPAVIHEVKRRVVDSFACIVGAVDAPPSIIARRVTPPCDGTTSATVVGLPAKTTIDGAAFANSVMVRYLDFNDQYFTPRGGGQHPSDIIPAALATAEALQASGRDLILSVVVAYEVGAALAGVVRIRERGWDMGTFIAVAAAMASGKILGLTRSQLMHAAAIAVTSNIATRQTRVGQLSMWKGCATAASTRNGIFAALLAREDLTGPAEPFSGKDGIMDLVTGPFTLADSAIHSLTLPQQGPFAVQLTNLKVFPAEYSAQGPIELASALRDSVDLGAIEQIHVLTYGVGYTEIGMESAKWNPYTRETADHSLPYLVAVALADGRVTPHSFSAAKLSDPIVRSLMARVTVDYSQDFSERFPQELNCRLTIDSHAGQRLESHLVHPRGHARCPLSDADVHNKFCEMAASRVDTPLYHEVEAALWELDVTKDVSSVWRPLGTALAISTLR